MKKIIAGFIAAGSLLVAPVASAVEGPGGNGPWTPHPPAEASHYVWDCDFGAYVQYNSWTNITNSTGKVVGYTLTSWHPTMETLAGHRSLTEAERTILKCDERPAVTQAVTIENQRTTIQRLRDRLAHQSARVQKLRMKLALHR